MRTDPRGKQWSGELLAGHTGNSELKEQRNIEKYVFLL